MIRIVVIGAPPLISFLHNLEYAPPSGIHVSSITAVLEDAVVQAKRIENDGEVDVFVSAGLNAKLMEKAVTKPLVEIKVTGFDILKSIKIAKQYSNRVAIFVYEEQLSYLNQVKDILTVEIKAIIYKNLVDVERSMDILLNEGIRVVIGTSNVIESAKRRGMIGVFIHSLDSIKIAIDMAIQIAVSSRAEAAKAEELRTILNFTYGGVIATNQKGIIRLFNPSAEKITGIPKHQALGVSVSRFFPKARIGSVLKNRKPELNKIQQVANRNVLTNTIPILHGDAVTGVVMAFQDINTIQEAESKIRKDIFSQGFVAKTTFSDILGRSESICRACDDAYRYAQSDATVTIFGESGTGKELFARGIHNASARSKKPFVAINCASLPESLLESELFGYEEGAFTGARRGGRHGFFELAHGGTIFLDEIAEMPISLQNRLLRVVEERDLVRIGGEKIFHVDVRVIAATNKDLSKMVEHGLFRADLYYRLSVLELHIPPLRKRRDDISFLAGIFVKRLRPDLSDESIKVITEIPAFQLYAWPGNIRELKNLLERFSVLFESKEDPLTLMNSLFQEKLVSVNERHIIDGRERRYSKILEAKKLGISRTTLWRRLKRDGQGSSHDRGVKHT